MPRLKQESRDVFVNIHSNYYISDNMRRYREQKVRENIHIYGKKNPSGSMLDSEFSLYDLKHVLQCCFICTAPFTDVKPCKIEIERASLYFRKGITTFGSLT